MKIKTDSPLRHGQSKTALYRLWRGMIARCYNPARHNFARYGGRGITVCDAWLRDFPRFVADVGPRPSRRHSLDRYPDGNGDYEPGNVRWATLVEQASNKRNNRLVPVDGQLLTRSDAARRVGMSYDTLRYRLEAGWSAERALSQPSQRTPRECTQ